MRILDIEILCMISNINEFAWQSAALLLTSHPRDRRSAGLDRAPSAPRAANCPSQQTGQTQQGRNHAILVSLTLCAVPDHPSSYSSPSGSAEVEMEIHTEKWPCTHGSRAAAARMGQAGEKGVTCCILATPGKSRPNGRRTRRLKDMLGVAQRPTPSGTSFPTSGTLPLCKEAWTVASMCRGEPTPRHRHDAPRWSHGAPGGTAGYAGGRQGHYPAHGWQRSSQPTRQRGNEATRQPS